MVGWLEKRGKGLKENTHVVVVRSSLKKRGVSNAVLELSSKGVLAGVLRLLYVVSTRDCSTDYLRNKDSYAPAGPRARPLMPRAKICCPEYDITRRSLVFLCERNASDCFDTPFSRCFFHISPTQKKLHAVEKADRGG